MSTVYVEKVTGGHEGGITGNLPDIDRPGRRREADLRDRVF